MFARVLQIDNQLVLSFYWNVQTAIRATLNTSILRLLLCSHLVCRTRMIANCILKASNCQTWWLIEISVEVGAAIRTFALVATKPRDDRETDRQTDGQTRVKTAGGSQLVSSYGLWCDLALAIALGCMILVHSWSLKSKNRLHYNSDRGRTTIISRIYH